MESNFDRNDDAYVYHNNRMLRKGYTTGTCAAGATKAAVRLLLTGKKADSVLIVTPNGRSIMLKIENASLADGLASCSVMKDGGDDADITNGMMVCSTVSRSKEPGVTIVGGDGVGTVTRRGLDQPPGNAAINSVPRMMISDAVESECPKGDYLGGFKVVISIPGGKEASKRTFNPRLGIVGGLSVIGTTGIVEPMSDDALVATIRTEMKVKVSEGCDAIVLSPGNYGRDFAVSELGFADADVIRCSNFIGKTLDSAAEFGLKSILMVGNLGKMIKIAGGIMDTHSRNADCRMEILAANALRAGADSVTASSLLDCLTTDEALSILLNANLVERIMPFIMGRVRYYLSMRTSGKVNVEAVVFSSEFGLLGMTDGAKVMIQELKKR